MYNYIVEQEDIDILRQTTKTVYCKVELLNNNLQTVNTIEGHVYNDNFSVDGDATTRRTYSCDIIVTNSSFNIGKDKNIWIDRFIRVFYGILNQRTNQIKWYTLGTFTFVDMSYSYSTTEKTLSLTCSDMMSKYDGTKGGVMVYDTEADITFKLLAGQDMRECIIGLLNFAGITNFSVSGLEINDTDGNYTIPYDIEWGNGTTFCEAWSEINELYNYWEFFFDENGKFIWRKKPKGLGEEIILDSEVLSPLVVSEQLNDSFQNIYNVTEIWGQELDIAENDRYVSECSGGTSSSNNVYKINLSMCDSWDDIDNFENVAIKVSGDYGQYIQINGGMYREAVGSTEKSNDNLSNLYEKNDTTYTKTSDTSIQSSKKYYLYVDKVPILNSVGDELAEPSCKADRVYVFRYRRTATGSLSGSPYLNFYCMGQFQAHAIYKETNPNVPYSIYNLGQEIPKVIENQKLYSDEVCYSQAQYETYKTTAKQDTISLTTMIIPFLEPTQKIKYTLLNSGETDEWVIKSYSWSTMSGTMTIELYRFLQDYSYVYN